jgi:hypothetical protein
MVIAPGRRLDPDRARRALTALAASVVLEGDFNDTESQPIEAQRWTRDDRCAEPRGGNLGSPHDLLKIVR